MFFGVRLRGDDPGNIHFGFVGSVLFTTAFLQFGAGMYQIFSGTSNWRFMIRMALAIQQEPPMRHISGAVAAS